MMDVLRHLSNRLAATLTRARALRSRIGPRTLLQVAALDNETFDDVPLLLPPGYVANVAGGDLLLVQVNGSRDHKVALGGDLPGDAIGNLPDGTTGLSRGGRTILMKPTGIEITDPLQIVLQVGGVKLVLNAAGLTLTGGGTLHTDGPITGGSPLTIGGVGVNVP